MTKITKREYNNKKAELQAQIAKIDFKLNILSKWESTIDYTQLTDQMSIKISKIGEYWNNLHDKKWELEKELQLLEDRWETRNWTGADWNSWELVTSNID